jgi:hypothetical protein
MANDRRQSPRVHSLNFVAEEAGVYRTLDVSPEGMLLEMGVPAPLGSRLELRVAFGEEIVPLHARVVRHELLENRGVGVGVRFEDLTEPAQQALTAEVASRRS